MSYKDREKQRKYQREWRAARRSAWIEENGPCALCGSSDELTLDHVEPSQKVEHNVWSWSKERREEELAKCQVLCRLCHSRKTRESKKARHGTESRYQGWKCRCDLCRAAHSARLKRQRSDGRRRKKCPVQAPTLVS